MNDRYILAIDTSTSTMTVSLLKGGQLLAEIATQAERNHSIRLAPAIEEMLQSLQLTPEQLGGIAVGHGPGSYTGVRIGVTVAKTMAWALQIPVVGVSSLAALTHGAIRIQEFQEGSKLWVIPLMDARRGQVYTGRYVNATDSNHKLNALTADRIILLEQWLNELAFHLQHSELDQGDRPNGMMFVGETEPFMNQLSAFAETISLEVSIVPLAMRAVDIGLLGMERLAQGETEDIHSFVPNYTQLAEAEAKWLANHK